MSEIKGTSKSKDVLICYLQTFLDRACKIIELIEEDSNPFWLKQEATKFLKEQEEEERRIFND